MLINISKVRESKENSKQNCEHISETVSSDIQFEPLKSTLQGASEEVGEMKSLSSLALMLSLFIENDGSNTKYFHLELNRFHLGKNKVHDNVMSCIQNLLQEIPKTEVSLSNHFII